MTDITPVSFARVPRAFWFTLLINGLWINASEVFRYFAFVMPMLRDAFPMIEGVAPMSLSVFGMWAIWDTILVVAVTGCSWMFLERFGLSLRNAILAGSSIWMAIFVILWLGLWNMRMATPGLLAVALPLSWLEMVIAAFIVRWGMVRFARP